MTITLAAQDEKPATRARRGTDVRKRQAQVGVRLLPEEMAQLRQAAERASVSPAEILRRAFLALIK